MVKNKNFMMNKKIAATGTFLGMIAIILGAFGAHILKKKLLPEQLVAFETGVRYQMYQAFFLFFLATQTHLPIKKQKMIYNLIVLGVFLFSGSIYLLATRTLTSFDISPIGFVTPIGGLLLIIGWGLLGVFILKNKTPRIGHKN